MVLNTNKVIASLEDFKNKRVLVLGDLMLDQYLYGGVSRVSPEAPVLVVKFKKNENFLGGAGNTANNLTALGAKVFIVGVIGNDSNGKTLIDLFQDKGINTEGLILDKNRQTTLKQRIVSGSHQLLRADYEDQDSISKEIEDSIIYFVQKKIEEIDAIAVSDYNKGIITPTLMKNLINLANSKQIPIIADLKPINWECFVGVTLITPNLKEAKEITRLESENIPIEEIGKRLVNDLKSTIFITRGEDGITLFEKEGEINHFPTKKVNIFDVTGAGDTVLAFSTLGLVSGLSFKEIAEVANIAGRIVVQKPGTSIVSIEEIKECLNISQINLLRKKVDKEWGYEDWIVNYESSNYCGKKLILNKGYQCSIHYHKIKNEVFYINKGFVLLYAYDEYKLMKPGDSIIIEPGTKHRFIGLSNAEIIEFSSHHKDEDSYRDEPSGKVEENIFKNYLDKYASEIVNSLSQ
jgi:rfaE bifunctional protein kinase chain/domain